MVQVAYRANNVRTVERGSCSAGARQLSEGLLPVRVDRAGASSARIRPAAAWSVGESRRERWTGDLAGYEIPRGSVPKNRGTEGGAPGASDVGPYKGTAAAPGRQCGGSLFASGTWTGIAGLISEFLRG